MTRPRSRAQRARPPRIPARFNASHIVVAAEGSTTVSPEILMASAIAARHGSRVDVLSVVIPQLPTPVILGPVSELPPPGETVRARRHHVRDELHRAGRSDWKETIVTGWPAGEIPAIAKRLGVTKIVVGIGRDARIDRLPGSGTVLQDLALVDVPVLAVAHDATELPRGALAAVDSGMAEAAS
jgi:nucleotide-binding universal stress UspA family protein